MPAPSHTSSSAFCVCLQRNRRVVLHKHSVQVTNALRKLEGLRNRLGEEEEGLRLLKREASELR